MTAITSDVVRPERAIGVRTIHTYGVKASTKIPKGSLVMITPGTSAYAVKAADTASSYCVGVAMEIADNTNGSDGDINVKCAAFGEFFFAGTGSPGVGLVLEVSDNNTVTDSGTAANHVKVGLCTQTETIEGSAGYWVRIDCR